MCPLSFLNVVLLMYFPEILNLIYSTSTQCWVSQIIFPLVHPSTSILCFWNNNEKADWKILLLLNQHVKLLPHPPQINYQTCHIIILKDTKIRNTNFTNWRWFHFLHICISVVLWDHIKGCSVSVSPCWSCSETKACLYSFVALRSGNWLQQEEFPFEEKFNEHNLSAALGAVC